MGKRNAEIGSLNNKGSYVKIGSLNNKGSYVKIGWFRSELTDLEIKLKTNVRSSLKKIKKIVESSKSLPE